MRPPKFPVLDDHFHLDPRGKKWKAVNEFKRSGGTHIILVSKPYFPYPYRTIEDYRRIYETTLRLARESEEKTGVKVFVALGPHPADMTENVKRGMELENVKELMKQAIDLAAKYVEEGRAIAIGEVGRPHYEVPKRIWKASNEVMEYSFQVAKELGCAVILHTESANPGTFKEIASRAEKIGIKKEKVVKHFSGPLILERENFGLVPSVISMDNLLKAAIAKGNRFMMETDYIDDPKRPGAVLGPKTVPRKTYKMLESELFTEDDVWRIHCDLPRKVYGIEVEIRWK